MDEDGNITLSAKGLGEEVVKAVHAAKSYVATAFLTLLLYYIGFYIIGLVCNLVFLSQANDSRRIAGRSPSGRGCLLVLLWIHLLIPAILVVVFIVVGALASLSL
ncbi:MAG: hypothetical protein K9M45_12710 [Kiritimatiellales bacterium]|nr:hypothetical protein [Kiritimatiellales bacterium]